MKTALVAGATGLTGRQLVNLLLRDDRYQVIKVLSRSPLTTQDPRLKNFVVDFKALQEYADQLAADDVFCCLGTTMKKAGSKPAFEAVDYEYPLSLAHITKAQGASQYLLVSALGADKYSSIYYNQVKGRIEEALCTINFNAIHIFRPSLLLGAREEKRAGEDAAKLFYKLFNFLIPKKYKSIDASKVANAMLHYARTEQSGIHFHESASLQKF